MTETDNQSGETTLEPEITHREPICDLGQVEAIYLKIVEASPDAKIVINEDGRVIVFNVQAELMFGYDRQEVLGQEIEMLIPNQLREKHIDHRTGFFNAPGTREMGTGQVLEGLHRNGTNFQIQIKLAPMVIPKTGVHVLAVVRRVKN